MNYYWFLRLTKACLVAITILVPTLTYADISDCQLSSRETTFLNIREDLSQESFRYVRYTNNCGLLKVAKIESGYTLTAAQISPALLETPGVYTIERDRDAMMVTNLQQLLLPTRTF
jgi:hypothetical protein